MSETAVIYDISVSIETETVTWPGDPGIKVTQPMHLDKGDPATVTSLDMGAHTGTHVDAFCHFIRDGKALDEMRLSCYVGPAYVIEIDDPSAVTVAELQKKLASVDTSYQTLNRILFKTKNSATRWHREPFNEEFIYITPEAAEFLVTLGVQLVGIDYLSVEQYGAEGAPTHHVLMEAGIYILEGLYLGEISQGWYELIALPLKITGADGAPARAILRELH